MLPRPRRQTTIAVGVVTASIALVGCGSKPATRASVIARGDAVCATANRALANLPAANGGSGTTINFIKAAPIVTREVQALTALPRPAADRSTLDRFLAEESSLAADYRQLAALQKTGNDGAVQSGLTRLGRIDPGTFARRYGLVQCGTAVATVR